MDLRFLPSLCSLCIVIGLALASGISKADTVQNNELTQGTLPLFQEFCFKCHSDKRTKGNLNLQQLSTTPDFGAHFKTWDRVIERLETKEMPPEDEKELSHEQR